MVLGGVFPFWHSGHRTEDIIVFGLTVGHLGLRDSMLLGNLFPLQADPTKPRIYSSRDVYTRLTDELQHSVFRLQALPEYEPDPMIPYEQESIAAWNKGRSNESIRLMQKLFDLKPFWVNPVYGQTRVVIIDDALTNYQLWQLEHWRQFALRNGHSIFLLHRKWLADIEMPDGDFTIFDQNRVTVNGYAHARWIYTLAYNGVAGADINSFLRLQRQLLKIARTKGHRLRA
jgi:hypothetical protein